MAQTPQDPPNEERNPEDPAADIEYEGFGATDPDVEDDVSETAAAGGDPQTIAQAVAFNQTQLTSQAGEVLSALENPVAEQAAVLMLEDLRGFMQGSEQLVLAASGKAMALLLDPLTQSTGESALTALATWQTSLTTFAGAVTTTASTIKTDFSS